MASTLPLKGASRELWDTTTTTKAVAPQTQLSAAQALQTALYSWADGPNEYMTAGDHTIRPPMANGLG
ncbi:hypothetical protein V6N11_081473 [Hibiscus sabdariffa]|uniref:Uncharacterized protein n=1 Tax=Hibiscus sabdariffa TaxID=183260 RepID=A0ABR2N6V4_9ROSI